jgi:uncharacterized protein (UPF0261 family)
VESVPPEMLKRKHVIHNPIHTHVRATYEEMSAVGHFIAERLARSLGPAHVMIPKRGFTALNIAGGPMYDPHADGGFLFGLTRELNRCGARNVKIEEMDLHINDPAFAAALAERINALVRIAQPQAEASGG